jgi:hypothetical protein
MRETKDKTLKKQKLSIEIKVALIHGAAKIIAVIIDKLF